MLNDLHSELKQSSPNMWSFVDEHDIQMLPKQEQAWVVPQPVVVYQQPTEPGYTSHCIQSNLFTNLIL